MTLSRTLVAVVGFALAMYLVLREGFGDVFQALHVAGWRALLVITLLHVVPTVLCGIAWWLLAWRRTAESWPTFTWIRWVRDGLDGVIPFFPLTGELVGIRLLGRRHVPLADAVTIVDVTAELFGQVLFAALAWVLLFATHPQTQHLFLIAAGVAVLALQLGGFLFAQKRGLFRLIEHPLRWIRQRSRSTASDAGSPLHERVLAVYAVPGAFAGSVLLHFAAWIISGFEAWFGFWFMGHPLRVAEVIALEGLVYGIRSLTFFIPLGAGVQEGGYLLLAGPLGLPPDLALAISLLKRGRDLILGIPALLLWQALEARHITRARNGALRAPGTLAASDPHDPA